MPRPVASRQSTPGAIVDVRVLDVTGTPIAGAFVRGYQVVLTDEDGRAIVSWNQTDVVAGVSMVAPGYATAFIVRRGRAPTGLELAVQLRALVRVTGAVCDDAGVPVAGAVVRQDDDAPAEAGGAGMELVTIGAGEEARTRAGGKFSIVVPEGEIRLFASKPGFCASDATSFRAPASDVELVVQRTFEIVAVLADERGAPVRGQVRVEHVHPDLHPADELPRAWSDAPDMVVRTVRACGGVIRVTGIRPGSSRVRLRRGNRCATLDIAGAPGDVIHLGTVKMVPANA